MKLNTISTGAKTEHSRVSAPKDSRAKVGIITLMADLYRQNIPELPQKYSSHWRKTFQNILPDCGEIYFAEVVSSKEAFALQLRECESRNCDLLIILPLAYASSEYSIEGLIATKLPFVVISSCRDQELTCDISGEHLLANQAIHGVQELTNMLWRKGKEFYFLAGHPSQPDFCEKLRRYIRVSQGARVFKRGRIGRVGKPLDGMMDFLFEKTLLAEKLGFEVVAIDPFDIVSRAAKLDSQKVEDYITWLKSSFVVSKDITIKELCANASISIAMEDIVKEMALDAVSMNFMSVINAGSDALPFMGASHLMSKGFGYAGEGDVLTAALNSAISQICKQSTFTEMFCPDYTKKEILLSHMGECNFSMADTLSLVKLKPKVFAWGNCQRLVVPIFQLRAGEATLVSITETPDKSVCGQGKTFRLVTTKGQIIKAPDHPNLRSPYTRISFGEDMSSFLERYSRAGGTHHLVLAHGDILEEIEMLANICHISCKII